MCLVQLTYLLKNLDNYTVSGVLFNFSEVDVPNERVNDLGSAFHLD